VLRSVFLRKSAVVYCRESYKGIHPPGLLTGKIAGLFDRLLSITFASEIMHVCLRLVYLQRNMKERTSLMLA